MYKHVGPLPRLDTAQANLLLQIAAGHARYLPSAAGVVMDYPTHPAKVYTLGALVTLRVGELVLAGLVETELPEGGLVKLTGLGQAVAAGLLGVAA